MNKVIVLGSTGSIGKNALAVLRKNKSRFKVIGLSAGGNVSLLNRQIAEFSPDYAALQDESKVKRIKGKVKVFSGSQGINALARMKSDVVILGISGIAALEPLLECIGNTRRVLLANKESIVSAWPLIKTKLKNSGTEIVPVDSEANAIFQLLLGIKKRFLNKIYITASGGPFLNWNRKDLAKVKISQALKHPRWKMGKRITIDSASLVNKGFEVMEAHFLFGIPLDKIEVVIHPQSVVHSLAEASDGCLLASFFSPDMRIPINYALYYPDISNTPLKRLDLYSLEKLEFLRPDFKKFPGLKLALEAAMQAGTAPAVFAAADEEAVRLFLEGKISFNQIPQVLRRVLLKHRPVKFSSYKEILFWIDWAKQKVAEACRMVS